MFCSAFLTAPASVFQKPRESGLVSNPSLPVSLSSRVAPGDPISARVLLRCGFCFHYLVVNVFDELCRCWYVACGTNFNIVFRCVW